jgi:osmoprotectant transport system permease protein
VSLLLVLIAGLSVVYAAFVTIKPNRIAKGESKYLVELLDQPSTGVLLGCLVVWAVVHLLSTRVRWRLLSANVALWVLLISIGVIATTFATKPIVRVTPSSAFWLLFGVLSLSITDSWVRLKLKPWHRLVVLGLYLLVGGGVLWSGVLDDLAIMREFYAREATFWQEALRHLQLTLGALSVALLIGLPLGVWSFQVPALRQIVLQTLSLVQTIPSIALFGLLMAPLGWLAAQSTGAQALGISGIGAAPALVALVIYNLLPIVANTVIGLESVAPAVRDAAKGMGLTRAQRLWQVDIPLAFPVILTGVRIVLVQGIGLVTVAALIGGGGFGTFVFQGLGQTSTDLVLLGALPIVGLAWVAAVILDALAASLTVTEQAA